MMPSTSDLLGPYVSWSVKCCGAFLSNSSSAPLHHLLSYHDHPHRVSGSASVYFATSEGAQKALAADGMDIQGRSVGIREVGSLYILRHGRNMCFDTPPAPG